MRLATTPEEREALYALRYEVYGLEKGWSYGGVDHERRRVADAMDEAQSARHLYAGEPSAVKGTMRAQVFEPGEAPAAIAESFGFSRIRGIERYRVAEFGRFVIQREHRGGAVMPALVRGALEQILAVDGVDLVFCSCRPHLVRYYRRMGFRPYDVPNIHSSEGIAVPLLAVLADPAFLKSAGSVFASDARRYLRRSQRPVISARDLGPIFDADKLHILDEAREVFSELERGLHRATQSGVAWPTSLSQAVMEQCESMGYILDLRAGENLVRQGRGESEIFVMLRGSVEVLVNDQRITTRGEGEILGEMAWFLESGKRTSTLRALEPCRVLVLDRRFPDELAARDPHAALELHKVIGRTLAMRLDSANRAIAEREAELAALKQGVT